MSPPLCKDCKNYVNIQSDWNGTDHWCARPCPPTFDLIRGEVPHTSWRDAYGQRSPKRWVEPRKTYNQRCGVEGRFFEAGQHPSMSPQEIAEAT